MSVVNYREVSGRSLSHRFGEPPTAERRFVVTLDNTAPTSFEVIQAIGILHGSRHPEYPYMTMTEGSIAEGSPTPLHCEVTFRYEVLKPDKRDPNPLARPDTWQFSTGGNTVPALTYYDGSTVKPLVNSAYDLFEGLTTEEAEVRATISGNRLVFPLSTAGAVTNCVNSDSYMGGNAHTWKCVGISGSQQVEVVNDVEINFWSISVELLYRQSGWSLQIPDVGFNYISGSTKKRCWVYDDSDPPEKVDSPNAVPLNSSGSMKAEGELADILVRRLNPEVSFSSYFGSPTWFVS